MDAPTNPDIHGLHLDAAHKALSSARAAYACQPMHEDPPPPVLETAGAVGLMESDE